MNIKDWQKENPNKTINDYYASYPIQTSKRVDRSSNENIGTVEVDQEYQVNIYKQIKEPKSVLISVILTLMFGPFGLMYSSVSKGLTMILIPVIGVFIGFVLPLLCESFQSTSICMLSMAYWAGFFIFLLLFEFICIVMAITTVKTHNSVLIHQ